MSEESSRPDGDALVYVVDLDDPSTRQFTLRIFPEKMKVEITKSAGCRCSELEEQLEEALERQDALQSSNNDLVEEIDRLRNLLEERE